MFIPPEKVDRYISSDTKKTRSLKERLYTGTFHLFSNATHAQSVYGRAYLYNQQVDLCFNIHYIQLCSNKVIHMTVLRSYSYLLFLHLYLVNHSDRRLNIPRTALLGSCSILRLSVYPLIMRSKKESILISSMFCVNRNDFRPKLTIL